MYFNHLKGSTVDSVLVKPECEKYLSKANVLPFSKEQEQITIKLQKIQLLRLNIQYNLNL